MIPADRARLADALATATPAQLREDADYILGLVDDFAAARLAALALAVSRAMDFDSRVEQADGRDFLVLDIGLPDAHGLGYGGCDLPAALAALIRPEGA